MIFTIVSMLPAIRASRSRLFRGLSLLALCSLLTGVVFAQADPTQGGRRQRGGNATDPNAGGGRGNFDPAQMQQQMLDRLREQFAITDDAEWKLISDKISAVNELRRSAAPGGGFGRGGPGGPGGQGGQTRGTRGGGGNPESDALRQAITDNLPEAEIKSRLARLRESRKANEEKLTKAQDDLRALLSVKQEAVAVMFGILP